MEEGHVMNISETKVELGDIEVFQLKFCLKICSSTGDRVPDERQWFYFIFVSLGSYFALLLLAIIYLLIKSKCVDAQHVCNRLLRLKVDGNTGLRSTNQKLNHL